MLHSLPKSSSCPRLSQGKVISQPALTWGELFCLPARQALGVAKAGAGQQLQEGRVAACCQGHAVSQENLAPGLWEGKDLGLQPVGVYLLQPAESALGLWG